MSYITNFPGGVSSFGIPILGSGVRKYPTTNCNFWFIDPTLGNDGNPYTLAANTGNHGGNQASSPFKTLTYALSLGVAGDYFFLAAGNFNENVVVTKNYQTFIGAGIHATFFKPRSATTFNVVTPLGETQMTAVTFVVTSRGCEFCNFSIQASNTADGGFYIGDGGRVNSTATGVTLSVGNPNGVQVHDVHFDGNGVGEWAITLDGMGPGTMIYNNHIYNWNPGAATGGGIVYCSGLNKDQVGALIFNNYITGIKGAGVKRANGSVSYGNVIGPNNMFADFSGVAMLEGVNLTGTGGPDSIVGNYFGCTNTFTGTATDFQSGNYKTTAGNTTNFVSQA